MKRAGAGLAWLAATYAGGLLYGLYIVHSAYPPPPWYVGFLITVLPTAVLLAVLARDRLWSFVVAAGIFLVPFTGQLAKPGVSALVHPLAPPLTFPPEPRVDYLPELTAYYILAGVFVGLVELAFLWPYLRPFWMWPAFKVLAGAATALSLVFPLTLPLPGVPNAVWNWPGPLVGAIAFGLLWRFEAEPPRLRRPLIRLPRPAEEQVDPVYAAWMEDLEESLGSEPARP